MLLIVLVVSGLFLALQYHADPGSLTGIVDALRAIGDASENETGDSEPGDDATIAGESPPAASRERILECRAKDGSTFYTNAARCEDADLDNRLTEVPAIEPAADPAIGRNCLDPEVYQQFLPACAEPFRAALELESRLAETANPLDSPYAMEYCDLIAQGAHAGCPASSATFCYLRVCQQLAERASSP